MPPKKSSAPGQAPSKKTETKKKEKVIEDKTFGLKNKKGAKSQKFIAQVEKQVKTSGDPKTRKIEEERALEKKKKEELKKKEEEDQKLFRPVVKEQVVESGVDPKSIFCAFFKQGLCKKGAKCKFSHDPAVERKAAKRNMYDDVRAEGGEDETMEDWNEEELNEVIMKKHGAEKTNQTDIICKFFLDAVENNKYGWFWQCPNGGNTCMYRHALPPGFTLKKDKNKREDKGDEISLEELIEGKRAELSARTNLTKVTLESFVLWKKRKLKEKAEKLESDKVKKKDKYKAGLTVGMSGREMFMFDPNMIADMDDEEGGEFDLSKMGRQEEEDDGVKVHEIKFDEFGIMDDGLDESTEVQLAKLKGALMEATGPIDENLFEDEDLDELEDDLTHLDV